MNRTSAGDFIPPLLRPKNVLLTALIASAVPVAAQQFIIDLPDLLLQPNTPGQSFDLYVQNDDVAFPVTGIRVELMVADGGTEAGGTVQGPAISNVDVTSGTAFASPNNNGPGGQGSVVPQLFERSTLTPSGTVNIPSGSSKFATVTFDTTGFGPGTEVSYTVNTGPERNGPTVYHTQFGDYQPTLINGTLTVVPEPSQYAVISGVACLLGAVVYRRKAQAGS